jgi:hypothetical protein
MPLYIVSQSIAATPIDAPVQVTITPAERFVTGCEVMFDATSAWKLGVRVKAGGVLIWPAPSSDVPWISGVGGVQIRHDVHYKLDTNGRIVVEVYNVDSGAHTVEVRVQVDWFCLRLAALQLLDLVRRLLERFAPLVVPPAEDAGKVDQSK